MTIWRFELRRSLGTTVIWSLVVTGLAILFLAIFPLYEESAGDFLKLLEAYPPELLSAFNMNPETLFSYLGFYAFVLPFVFVAGAIYATSLGLSVIGREKHMQASDFLLTKPVARGKIWFQKSLAVKTLLVFQNIIFLVSMTIMAYYLEPDVLKDPVFWLMSLSLFLVQFVFSSLGMLLATVLKKLKNISGLAVATALSFYVISLLQSILENEALRYMTPFQYVNPQVILEEKSYDGILLTVTVIVSVGACVISYFIYTKQDIR